MAQPRRAYDKAVAAKHAEAKASDPTGATQPDLSVVEENEGEAMKSAQTKMNDASTASKSASDKLLKAKIDVDVANKALSVANKTLNKAKAD